jgi:hypothetical protein
VANFVRSEKVVPLTYELVKWVIVS